MQELSFVQNLVDDHMHDQNIWHAWQSQLCPARACLATWPANPPGFPWLDNTVVAFDIVVPPCILGRALRVYDVEEGNASAQSLSAIQLQLSF